MTSLPGLPVTATEVTATAVAAAYRGLGTDADRLSPAQWLTLAEDTGVPRRSVWTLV